MPLRVVPRRDRKLNRLVRAAEMVDVVRGSTLFEAGSAADRVLLVRSGYVRLVGSGPGRTRTVALAGPWEIAEAEALGLHRRRHTCIAGEAARIQWLDARAVFGVIKTTERTFEALMSSFSRDLDGAHSLAGGSGGISAMARLAYVVQDLAERWGRSDGDGIVVPHLVTHQVLGDLAGVHRSTVTTYLNDWLYEGILGEAERGFRVLDTDALGARIG